MSHRYSSKIIIRSDYIGKDGKCALALQVFINGQRKVLPVGARVVPEAFNRDTEKVAIGKVGSGQLINAIIHKMKSRADTIFYKAILDDSPLTASSFAEIFQNKSGDANFYEFMATEIEKERLVRARGTIKNYEKCLRRLKEFKSELTFSNLNLEFVRSFNRFMVATKKYEPNTVAKYHQTFLKFINIAINQKRRLENPYDNFKIQTARTERTWLTVPELTELVQLYEKDALTHAKQNALRAFLFMSFTGLRVGDLLDLDKDVVISDTLIFRPSKTRKTKMILKIPLSSVALNVFSDAVAYSNNNKLFNGLSDYTISRHMKDIISGFTTIGKHVTPHVARHTFATAYLALGGKVEELQIILGHSKIETTMIYVHISKEAIRSKMQNFDKYFKATETHLQHHH